MRRATDCYAGNRAESNTSSIMTPQKFRTLNNSIDNVPESSNEATPVNSGSECQSYGKRHSFKIPIPTDPNAHPRGVPSSRLIRAQD